MRNRVKEFRAIQNMTQSQLAELISVSRQTIHAIESGKYVPSTVLALKMAREFSVKVEDLFQLDE